MTEQQRASELEQLQAISQRLEADLSLEEMLKAILDGVQSLVLARAPRFALRSTGLYVALTRGIRPDGEPLAPAINEGLTGWLARQRRRCGCRISSTAHPPAASACWPMARWRAAIWGCRCRSATSWSARWSSSAPANGFSAADERLLTIVAGQAAQAISNTRRYEQADEHLRSRVQQLTALQRISRQLTSNLSLGHILGFTLEEALRATQATNGYIALREGFAFEEAMRAFSLDEGHDSLVGEDDAELRVRVIAAIGYSDLDHTRLLAQSVSGSTTLAELAMTSGEPALADDLTAEDRLAAIGPAAAAALAVPIYYEAQVVGVVNLHSQTAHAFTTMRWSSCARWPIRPRWRSATPSATTSRCASASCCTSAPGCSKKCSISARRCAPTRRSRKCLEQIAFSIVETIGFRGWSSTWSTRMIRTILRVVTAAGLPLEELDRIRQGTWPVLVAQRFLDTRFRLGRAFFIPRDAGLEIDRLMSTSASITTTFDHRRAAAP